MLKYFLKVTEKGKSLHSHLLILTVLRRFHSQSQQQILNNKVIWSANHSSFISSSTMQTKEITQIAENNKNNAANPNGGHLVNGEMNIELPNGRMLNGVMATYMEWIVQNPRALVVCIHGAPGSHKCFEAFAPFIHALGFNVIALNLFGFGITPSDDHRLDYTNSTINAYYAAIIDSHLKDKIVDGQQQPQQIPIVFFSHSRGANNALRLASDSKFTKQTRVLLMANPATIRPFRIIRPFWAIAAMGAIWEWAGWFRPFLSPIFRTLAGFNGLSVGVEGSGNLFALIRHTEFQEQIEYIKKVRKNGNVQIVIGCSGRDKMIEPELSMEYMQLFGCEIIECTSTERNDMKLAKTIVSTMKSKRDVLQAQNPIGLMVQNEGHYLHKKQAQLFASMLDAIIE